MHVSDVTNEILKNPRFEGAMESITWLTDWTDVGFGMAITFVAFLIILVAMFKNVLAAAYCSYPKFWNHVSEAHEKKRDTNFIAQTVDMFKGTSSNIGAVNGGSVGEIIMGVIPDIKRMTDFEGDTIGAKQYFMKAIPQMLVCVCLGAFIYNGSYRDVAGLVVDTGTELLSRTLLECDPIALFDSFTGSAGRPVFSTDGAIDARGQFENQVAQKYYTAIIGTYTDIKTADQKRELATWCEATAAMDVDILASGDLAQYGMVPTGAQSEFSISVSMTWSTAEIDQTKLDAATGQVSDNPVTVQAAACHYVDNTILPTDMTVDSAKYLVTRIIATKDDVKSTFTGITDGVLYLDFSRPLNVYVNKNSGANVYFSTASLAGDALKCEDYPTDTKRRVLSIDSAILAGRTEFDHSLSLMTLDSKGNVYTHTIKTIAQADAQHPAGTVASSGAAVEWGAIDLNSPNTPVEKP